MDKPALLEMRGICKEFPGVKALDNVDLTVRPGTVHALMGENGAGKSTLMKCLFGIYHRDAGTIKLDGKEVDFKSSKDCLLYTSGSRGAEYAAGVGRGPHERRGAGPGGPVHRDVYKRQVGGLTVSSECVPSN